MPATLAGFSDGDLMIVHPPFVGKQAELYGETNYNEGRSAGYAASGY